MIKAAGNDDTRVTDNIVHYHLGTATLEQVQNCMNQEINEKYLR